MKVGEDPKVWFNVSTNLHRASNTYHSLTLSSKGPPEIRDVRPILSKASSDLMTVHWLLQGTLSLSLSLSLVRVSCSICLDLPFMRADVSLAHGGRQTPATNTQTGKTWSCFLFAGGLEEASDHYTDWQSAVTTSEAFLAGLPATTK